MTSISSPRHILFLDIDDVVMGKYPSYEEIEKKVHELFPDQSNYTPLTDSYSTEALTAVSHYFCKTAVGNLEKLIEKVNRIAYLKIVVSSSWRLGRTLEEVRGMLKIHSFSNLIIDRTAVNFSSNRGGEISHWLENNREKWDNYVALDDSDHGISQKHPNNFVRVCWEKLLTEADCNAAYEILMKPKDA